MEELKMARSKEDHYIKGDFPQGASVNSFLLKLGEDLFPPGTTPIVNPAIQFKRCHVVLAALLLPKRPGCLLKRERETSTFEAWEDLGSHEFCLLWDSILNGIQPCVVAYIKR